MIVIGYQGIGKSTLAAKSLRYIDLESSSFWFDDPETKQKIRHGNWYEMYCNVAEDLSRQGYTVFVSSHQPVRERLSRSDEYVIACVPALDLKDKWIKKLRLRYENSGLEKDYKAYMNAADCFTENVTEMMNSGFDVLEIRDMNYDFKTILDVPTIGGRFFLKEEVKDKLDTLKDWYNYKPFHDAVDVVERMVERMDV